MRDQANWLCLECYVKEFFPSKFEVMLELSESNPDDRLLIVCDVITKNTVTYEGPLLAILDICSMATIATNICNELCERAAAGGVEISKERSRG